MAIADALETERNTADHMEQEWTTAMRLQAEAGRDADAAIARAEKAEADCAHWAKDYEELRERLIKVAEDRDVRRARDERNAAEEYLITAVNLLRPIARRSYVASVDVPAIRAFLGAIEYDHDYRTGPPTPPENMR
jgi:hypothetical protein